MARSPSTPSSAVRAVVVACFFATGAAGLMYEIIWNKTLVLLMGNTAYALATLLTVFMGGLALGAWIGGRLTPDGPRALRLYGILETLLGLYCLVLPALLRLTRPLFETIYQSLGDSIVAMSLAQFAILGALLLIPTTLMGATLPILVRFITTGLGELSRSIGLLYAINSGGAFVGAMLAGFVVVPAVGVTSTYHVAIGINIAVGLVCFVLAGRLQGTGAGAAEPAADAVEPAEQPWFAPRLLLFGFGVSGFAAMVYSVAWTRAITLSIGSYSYAFTLITGAFILGLALGSIVLGRFGDRPVARFVLPAVPIVIALSALFTVPALGNLPIRVAQLMLHTREFTDLETAYFFAVFLIVLVPTFGMGGLLPLVARHLARTSDDAGRVVGLAYSSNTVGTILGAFACGFVLIPWIGMRNSILLGTALSAIVGALFLHAALRDRGGAVRLASASGLLVLHGLLMAAMPTWDRAVISSGPWINSGVYASRGTQAEQIRSEMQGHDIVFYREGVTGVVTVVKKAGLPLRLYVGGKNEAIDLSPTQNWLGHLPNFLRPDARRALVIGLGSSATLGSVARHRNIEHIDCVEISAGVVEAVRRYFSDINRNVLDDPRVHLRVGDGRQHLEYGQDKYDLIVSQPANPWLAGASAMFTKECFESMQRRLRPGGLACIWFGAFTMPPHTFQSLCATWGSVWKHPSLWQSRADGDYLFVGSDTPLALDYDAVAARMREPAIVEHMQVIGLPSPAHAFGYLISTDDRLRKLGEGHPLNTDDNSRIAYDTPLAMWRNNTLDIFKILHAQRVNPWQYVRTRHPNDSTFLANRQFGEQIHRSQQRIYQALTLTGPNARERGLQMLQEVLEHNKLDPFARTGYQILLYSK